MALGASEILGGFFDALGLTESERKEVYWAVAELVQNRLSKAKNI